MVERCRSATGRRRHGGSRPPLCRGSVVSEVATGPGRVQPATGAQWFTQHRLTAPGGPSAQRSGAIGVPWWRAAARFASRRHAQPTVRRASWAWIPVLTCSEDSGRGSSGKGEMGSAEGREMFGGCARDPWRWAWRQRDSGRQRSENRAAPLRRRRASPAALAPVRSTRSWRCARHASRPFSAACPHPGCGTRSRCGARACRLRSNGRPALGAFLAAQGTRPCAHARTLSEPLSAAGAY